MEQSVLVETPRPGVALVTLNRPHRLNALSAELFEAFRATMTTLDSDEDIRVIVLTGAGRGFCTGYDVRELPELADDSISQRLERVKGQVASLGTVKLLETPVIAAVNGAARGGGFVLAALADIRLAGESATFGVQFIKMGLPSGDAGLSWTLPRIVGSGVAADLMLTGRVIGAQEARDLGFVQEVFADDRLLDAALDKAELIAGNDRLALRQTKRVLAAAAVGDIQNAMAMEIITNTSFVDSSAFAEYVGDFTAPSQSSASSNGGEKAI